MASINDELKKLYFSKSEDLKKLVSEVGDFVSEDYANPLLMQCWEKEYLSSKYKVLFLGQETNGWNDEDDLDKETLEKSIMQLYVDFRLALNPPPHWVRSKSSFWRYVRDVNRELNGEDKEVNFLWSNVLKFGRREGIGKPNEKVLNAEKKYFNVLQEEINIIKPDVVIFFSGPNYDNHIRERVDGVVFEKCSDYSERKLSRLSHPLLPKHSFRTYHPGYLQRIGGKDIVDVIIKLIKG